MEKKTFTVTSSDAGQRVDKYLKKVLPTAPHSLIYKLLRKKDVKVNNKRVKEDYILLIGDEVVIFLTENQSDEFIFSYHFNEIEPTFNVIYEDDNILAVHKVSGLVVHATQQEKVVTLANMVLTYLVRKGDFNPDSRGYIPSPIARIDQDTEGIVVFSKKQGVHQVLANAFTTDNMVERVYRLVVYGIVKPVKGVINTPLSKHNGIVRVDALGQAAITQYKVIESASNKSYIEASILTGRQHQIRVHFQSIGHPIVGDKKYGIKDDKKPFALNAYSLTFNKLEFPFDYLNGKTLIADNTAQLKKILGE